MAVSHEELIEQLRQVRVIHNNRPRLPFNFSRDKRFTALRQSLEDATYFLPAGTSAGDRSFVVSLGLRALPQCAQCEKEFLPLNWRTFRLGKSCCGRACVNRSPVHRRAVLIGNFKSQLLYGAPVRSAEWFSAKFGIYDGVRRYTHFCANSSTALWAFLRKHGVFHGGVKYRLANERKRHTLENFIYRHGADGPRRHSEYLTKTQERMRQINARRHCL